MYVSNIYKVFLCIYCKMITTMRFVSTSTTSYKAAFTYFFIYFLFFIFFGFLGLHPQDMEGSRLEVQSELQLPAYNTPTATPDLSLVCDLHHSSRQCWILNPLSEARDGTHNLMVPSQIRFHCATKGTPRQLSNIHFI